MQRLVDVANEVNHEAHGVEKLGGAGRRGLQLRCVVCDGGDDTGVVVTVAVEVDAAAAGWGVVGVDEV